jgi:hypothetical protein
MVQTINNNCNYTINTKAWQLIFYAMHFVKGMYQKRTPAVSVKNIFADSINVTY